MQDAVTIRIQFDHGQPAVELINARSQAIADMLKGQTLDRACLILRTLLGLCPVAQTIALKYAYEAARAETTLGAVHIEDEQFVTIEAVLETLRVFTQDLSGLIPATKTNPAILKTLGQLRTQLINLTAEPWSARDSISTLYDETRMLTILWFTQNKALINTIKSAYQRFSNLGTFPTESLINAKMLLEPEVLAGVVNDLQTNASFALNPRINGQHRFTGALARNTQTPNKESFTVSDIVNARLAELQSIAAGHASPFTVHSVKIDDGMGLSLVETARGTLIYFVRLDNNHERLAQVQIIAPTEWAFQKDSSLVTILERYCQQHEQMTQRTEKGLLLIASAFDACTRVNVSWGKKHA
jgi:hypothetical protein